MCTHANSGSGKTHRKQTPGGLRAGEMRDGGRRSRAKVNYITSNKAPRYNSSATSISQFANYSIKNLKPLL